MGPGPGKVNTWPLRTGQRQVGSAPVRIVSFAIMHACHEEILTFISPGGALGGPHDKQMASLNHL